MITREKVKLKIKRLFDNVNIPFYATVGAAGMDICASLPSPLYIKPMERVSVPTGLIFEVPIGYEAQIRARSGLSIKHGLTLVNAIGTIDSDYRGEVKILMINLGDKTCIIHPDDRIAQVVVAPVARVEVEIVTEISETERSEGGFGSTGVSGT